MTVAAEQSGDPLGIQQSLQGHEGPSGRQQRTRHPALFFVVKRVLAGVVTLFVVSILIFVATNVLR
jgi:hypothetical protein